MKPLHKALAALAITLGTATAAQAATFHCNYLLSNDTGSSGFHTVEADSQQDALNQTIAWIYDNYGPVGFQLACYPQP
ncbi:hypothetical protein [Stenotrophomonas sp. 24(2023)]|uniref:hypothetical protein n=1 Tax=Stenotrophomonas sp. 24(2023) TaxID=3068324 RepID=UPI0027DEABD8|nr:hypothetical protein [Stenotrophomonas sp. 24(2023)]WMJ70032.1 hypothetical protein Q9R17_02685 [Stenotrophomonas sp. 24(2023)]